MSTEVSEVRAASIIRAMYVVGTQNLLGCTAVLLTECRTEVSEVRAASIIRAMYVVTNSADGVRTFLKNVDRKVQDCIGVTTQKTTI
jgi:hypothetical protein